MSETFDGWLKSNRIENLKGKLNDGGVKVLDDIEAIESMQDLEEFIKELDLKVIDRSKLKKAMLKVVRFGCAANKEEKEKNDENDEKMPSMSFNKDGTKRIDYYNRNEMKGLYQIPFDISINNDNKRKIRTILVIGGTGSGKTTAINSMMNYLWNVHCNDKFRYKLIFENENEKENNVTVYHIEPPKLNYSLRIVDIPGFGSTKGVTGDDDIVKQIKQCFNNEIEAIDGIFFTVKASQSKLTAHSRYIHDTMFGLFGKDIASNIFVLISFCDSKKPPVLAALEADKIPNDKYFKFNNYNRAFDLPESKDEQDIWDLLFWKMGIDSFDKLFEQLGKVDRKSLALTKQVLKTRQELDDYIKSMDASTHTKLRLLKEIGDNIKTINEQKKLMDQTSNFKIECWIDEMIQVPTSKNAITCLNCPGNYTCHRNCDCKDKRNCLAMRNDYCTICPNKCHWTLHQSLPYEIKVVKKKVTRTVQELKSKFCDAQSKVGASERMMARLNKDLKTIENEVNGSINKIKKLMNELKASALRPIAFSENDCIDSMITREESEKKQGWQERVKQLKWFKTKQDLIKAVCNEK